MNVIRVQETLLKLNTTFGKANEIFQLPNNVRIIKTNN